MNTKSEIAEEKKVWEKPQLIILARGEPEEAVLGSCKNASGGPDATPCSAATCTASTTS